MTFKPTILALAVAAVLSTNAKAATVVNGGFEADACPCASGIVPNGWTAGPLWDSGDNGGLDGLTNAVGTVHSGQNALAIGAVSSVGFANILQDLATTPGTSYTIDFFAESSGGDSRSILDVSAANGGVTLGSLILSGDIGATYPANPFSFTFTATG